jgi:hypothetical protein
MHAIYTGAAEHHLQGGRVRRFTPDGTLYVMPRTQRVGRSRRRGAEDHVENWGEGGLAARVFVGLSVGQTPTYSVEDVVKTTESIRREQGLLPDATFIAQKGLYTDSETGKVVRENSVQIIIFDVDGMAQQAFTDKIVQLARGLREHFKQQSVIIEIQNRGVAQAVLAVKE